MYLSRESNLCSLTQQIGIHDSFVDVPVTTLDSFLKRIGKIDFIRMVIEGYGVKVIHGMLDILNKDKPKMKVEIHPVIVGGEAIIGFLEKLKNIIYDTTFVIGRVFDNPAVIKGRHLERLSLDALIADKRITNAVNALMIFFEVPNQGSLKRAGKL